MKNLLLIFILLVFCFSCKSPEARIPENVQSGSFLKASAERNKKLNEREREQIQSIIKSNPDKEYIASKSGFWYYYNTQIESDTIQPKFGNVVNFTFDVSNIQGEKIYEDTNKTYIMDKEELFTGLREGLKLLKPTETATFLFPSQKAFGYYGDELKIGTNIPLICKVTLNTIIEKND